MGPEVVERDLQVIFSDAGDQNDQRNIVFISRTWKNKL